MRLLIITALVAGCTPAPAVPAGPSHVAPLRPGLVRLVPGAMLHRAADAASPAVRAESNAVVRAVSIDDPWIAIETSVTTACGSTIFDGLALRFYVPRSALMPVTTRTLAVEDVDGTGIAVPAGTPVFDVDRPRVEIWTWDVALPAARVRDGIGYVFSPSPEAPRAAHDSSVAAGASISVLGQWITSTRPIPMPHSSRVLRDDHVAPLLEMTNRCYTLRARVPNRAVDRGGNNKVFIGGYGFGRPRTTHQVRAGAALFWEDGSVAGTARKDVGVSSVHERGDLRCARVAVRYTVPGHDDEITVCAHPEDVR